MQQAPLGFDGLLALRSDISGDLALLAAPAAQSSSAAPAPKSKPKSDGTRRRVGLLFAGVAAVAFLIWIFNQDHTTSNSTSYGSKPSWATTDAAAPNVATPSGVNSDASAAAADAAAAASSAAFDAATAVPDVASDVAVVTEERPQFGADRQLSANEIAYCLAEKVRLEAAKTLLDVAGNEAIRTFNSAVDDYNARCGSYRYLKKDYDAATRYVDGIRSSLVSAGQNRALTPIGGAG